MKQGGHGETTRPLKLLLLLLPPSLPLALERRRLERQSSQVLSTLCDASLPPSRQPLQLLQPPLPFAWSSSC